MQRPINTLVIMSDQHHPRLMGCRGDRVIRTPNMDALAADGVVFSRTYCGNPLCVPSRMTFLTSQHSSDIHVWSNRCRLPSEIPTFLHGLTAAGVETVLCGRMHFADNDQRHGFESRIIGDVHARLEHIPTSTTGQTKAAVEIAGPGRTAYTAYDDAVTETACQWLLQRPHHDDDRPWCLVVGYVLPHCPYICPRDLFEEYYDKVDVPQVPDGYLESLHPAMRQWRERRGVDELSEDQRRIARAAYYGLVTYLDGLIGRVLAALREAGMEADTRVVYTSDHGDMAGDLGMWWKSSFYDGSVGVPMVWRGPEVAVDVQCDRVTSLLDIGPTLLDFADAPPLPGARGRSLRALLSGEAEGEWEDQVFAEYAGLQGDAPARMVRRGRWKLNHYHGYATPQLFDMEEDPAEVVDRAGDPDCTDVRRELEETVLRGWCGDHVAHVMNAQAGQAELLCRWREAVRPSQPRYRDIADRWTAPAGCNVFPDT